MSEPRFVAITATDDCLYALDSTGKVYWYDGSGATSDHAWVPLSPRARQLDPWLASVTPREAASAP